MKKTEKQEGSRAEERKQRKDKAAKQINKEQRNEGKLKVGIQSNAV